ncbi:tape measure protein [Pseudoxanthomonas mexicana]|uniref:tape measure protein n=1 Tax=Pseudoxanthomonas mexicana TaxID=128785 RepID=UPI00398B6E7A
MTDQTVTLRLTADGRGVAPGVRQAQSEIDKLGGTAQNAGKKAQQGIKGVNQEIERTARSASMAETMLKRFLGAAAMAQALVTAGRTADAYADIVGKLKQVSNGERELATAKAATFNIAQRYYQQLDATVTLYGRSARALNEYGYGQQKALKLTEAMSAALVVDRAGVAESASAIIQFSQALGSGVLRGEEFNSVNEAAPRIMKALSDSLGVTRGELRKMAEDGKLTIDVLVDALTGDQAERIIAEASNVPLTIGRAWQQAKNDALRYVGEADQGIGASSAVAQAISTLGKNLDMLATAAALAATVFAAQLVQKGLRAAHAAWMAQSTVVNTTTTSYLTHSGIVTTTTANTVRLTAAQTAAAVASRGLAAALAVVQANPIMLAVTAVVLLAGAFWQASRAAEAASENVRALHERVVLASDAYGEFAKAPTFQGITDLKSADEAFKELTQSVTDTHEKMIRAHESYLRVTARTGDTSASARRDVDEATAAYERQKGQLEALTEQRRAADAAALEEMQRLLGLNNISEQTQQKLAELAQRKRETGISSKELTEAMAGLAVAEGDVTRGAYIMANGIEAVGAAAQRTTGYVEKMNQQLQQELVRQRTAESGKRAGSRLEFGFAVLDEQKKAGGKLSQQQLADMYNAWNSVAAASELADQAQEKARQLTKDNAASTREASKATRDHARDLEQQAESQRRYTEQVERLEAELQGPVKIAEVEHAQRLAGIARELKEGNITKAAATRLEAAYEAQLKKTTAELVKQQNAPQALLDTMSGELRLLGMLGIERERYSRRLQNEADMRRAIAESIAAGNDALAASPQQQEDLIASARAMADWSLAAEESARQAQEWASAWTRGIESAADAVTDFAMSGLRDFQQLGRDLKSIAKQIVGDLVRTFLQQRIVLPIQAQLMGNGFAAAGGNLASLVGGGWLPSLLGGSSAAPAAGSLQGFGNNLAALYAMPGGSAAAAGSGGGMISKLLGSMGNAKLGGMLAGGLVGLQGGDNLLTKGLSGLSGAVAGNALSGALTATLAASKGGASIVGALTAGLKSIGPLGWVGLGATVLDKITGGGLFGTSWKATGSASQFGITSAGATGFTEVSESKKRSLFRGTKHRTTKTALDADALSSVQALFDEIAAAMSEAAAALAIDVPTLVGGTFRQEFDKNGNLTKEFGTIAGRIYNEAQEAFAERLLGENLLAVAKAVGASAEIERIAAGYRGSAESLREVATFLLAVQSDIKQSTQLWTAAGDGVLTDITQLFERLGRAGESLADTYARITSAANEYGSFMAGIEQQLLTSGLNDWQQAQLDIELQYRNQVSAANDYAKALGLSGARAEDLAKIEQLRALNMASLQRQMEEERRNLLGDLALSQYSPLRDDQKLAEAMQQLQAAVAAGNLNKASQLSQTALGLGRNLYASGNDYNALYNQVTGLLDTITVPQLEMDDGTTMGDLADAILSLPKDFARELFAVLYAPVAPERPTGGNTPPVSTGTGTGTSTNTGTGGNGSQDETNNLLRHLIAVIEKGYQPDMFAEMRIR